MQQAMPILYDQIGNYLQDQPEAVKAAVHGFVGGALNAAMGGDFAAGAAAGVLTSLVVDHLDEKLKGTSLSKEERDGVLELTSAIIGKVSGEVLKDSQAGNMAAFTAMEATEYNYLSHQQEEQKAKELVECKGMLCRAKVRTEWELISLGQDASLASGFAAAVPYSIYELGEGIVYLASHPVESYQAVKQLLQSEDVTGTITEAMRQEYLGRLQKIETEFQRAGAAGAFNAGFETGRIVMEVVGIAAGGAGIAKAGVKVTEKLVGYAGKLIPSTTKTTAATVAETSAAVRSIVAANRMRNANTASTYFPNNPHDLTKILGVEPKITITQHGTTRMIWHPNSNTRIRYESHPGDKGIFNPRHHGEHYHVEIKPDGLTWGQATRKSEIIKVKPNGYVQGEGTGFLPGEMHPGAKSGNR